MSDNALSKSGKWWEPSNVADAMALAETIANSGVVPKAYAGKPADVLVAMQMGAEVGLAPMQALQNIAVINGRPTVWGDGMLALVQGHPEFQSIHEVPAGKENGYVASCTVRRKGQPECTRTFSTEDAKRAGLWGKQGPWTQYPQRMLSMRARSWALRDLFADALRGITSAEEAMDIEEVTTRPVPRAAIEDVSGVAALKRRLAAKSAPEVPEEGSDETNPQSDLFPNGPGSLKAPPRREPERTQEDEERDAVAEVDRDE